jgi:hypothetical protein
LYSNHYDDGFIIVAEGRSKKEEARRKKQEAIKSMVSVINNVLNVKVAISQKREIERWGTREIPSSLFFLPLCLCAFVVH